MRTPRVCAIALLGLALVTGCTTTSAGEPEPTATTETSPAPAAEAPGDEELPRDGAPKVTDPLDTTRYRQQPCRALTSDDASSLNVAHPGEPYEAALGKACSWPSNRDERAEVDIRFLDMNPFGLSAEYRANEDGKWDVFEELPPVEGYPAVVRGGDYRDTGGCTVVVGTSDEIAFETVVQLSSVNVGEKDPCDLAAQVAGMALVTMRGDR